MEHMEPRFGPPHGVTFWELCPQVKPTMTASVGVNIQIILRSDSHDAHPASRVSLSLSFICFAAPAEKKKQHFFVK